MSIGISLLLGVGSAATQVAGFLGDAGKQLGEALTGAATHVGNAFDGAVSSFEGQFSETGENSQPTASPTSSPARSSASKPPSPTHSSGGSSRERNEQEQNRLNEQKRQNQQQLKLIANAKQEHTALCVQINAKKQDIEQLKTQIECATNSNNSDGLAYMATVGRSQRFQRRSVVKAAKVGELSAQIGFSRKEARESQEQAIKKCRSSKEKLDSLPKQQNKLMGELTQLETQSKKIQEFLNQNNDAKVINLHQQIKKVTHQMHQIPVRFLYRNKKAHWCPKK